MNKAETTSYPDEAFCTAMVTEGLGRFDILFDAVRDMYNAKNHAGIDRLMDLCLGTGNRGYVRTVAAAVKPVWDRGVSKEKFDRLRNFLIEGNEERKKNGWIPVEERLPEVHPGVDPLGRPMSKDVLVKYSDLSHSIDKMYYQVGKEPAWWNRRADAIAWMEIPN